MNRTERERQQALARLKERVGHAHAYAERQALALTREKPVENAVIQARIVAAAAHAAACNREIAAIRAITPRTLGASA